MMTGGIIIQKAQPPKPVKVGAGITIMKPMGVPQPNKSKLPEIPQFKGRGRGGPAPMGGLAAGMGRGRGRGGLVPGGGLMGKLGPMKGLAEAVNKPLAEQQPEEKPVPAKMADVPEEEKKEEVKEEAPIPPVEEVKVEEPVKIEEPL